MWISSLTISAARGVRDWVGLPVFSMRRFFHTGILVRADAGIARPQDLKGKRVGVPEYQQTAAVWCRGILSDEFGVDPRDLHWFMERPPEQSHGGSTGFTPPPGVRLEYIPTRTNIGEMLLAGELDATLLYLPEPNLVDRSRADLSGRRAFGRSFPTRRPKRTATSPRPASIRSTTASLCGARSWNGIPRLPGGCTMRFWWSRTAGRNAGRPCSAR